mgnify:CR=1 FL=1
MTKEEQQAYDIRYYSGVDEVELTEDVIDGIIKMNLWGDKESLRELREEGGKWNTLRHSVTFPAEPI